MASFIGRTDMAIAQGIKSFELEVLPFTGTGQAEEIALHFRDGRQVVVASRLGVKIAYDEATERTSTFRGGNLTGIYESMPIAARIRPQEVEETPPPTLKLRHAILCFLVGAASLSIVQHLVILFHIHF